MAQASYNARVMLGPIDLSCEVRQADMSDSVETIDVSTLCDTSKTFIPGKEQSSASFGGPLDVDASTDAPFDVYSTFKGEQMALTYAPSGVADGAEAFLMKAMETEFSTTAGESGSVDFSLSTQTNGATDAGKVLDTDTYTADGNGAAVDLGAAGSGGAATLHVTAFSGFSSVQVTIEDSANGSTGWATVGTFTLATGVTSEKITWTGSTERYLRTDVDVSGSGSTTVTVAGAVR